MSTGNMENATKFPKPAASNDTHSQRTERV